MTLHRLVQVRCDEREHVVMRRVRRAVRDPATHEKKKGLFLDQRRRSFQGSLRFSIERNDEDTCESRRGLITLRYNNFSINISREGSDCIII